MFKNMLKVCSVALIAGTVFVSCSADGTGGGPGTDSCSSVNCGDHGTCDDGVCVCETGYTGTLCDQEIRAAFYETSIEGTLEVSCSDTSWNYTEPGVVASIAAGPTVMDVYFVLYDTDSILATVISDTEFTIPTQTYQVTREIYGSGTLLNSTLTVNWTEEDIFNTCQNTYIAEVQ